MTTHTEQVDKLVAGIRAQRQDIVALCAELVAAPSVNPAGDTRQVAEVVTRALAARGVDSHLERCDPSMPSVVAHVDSGKAGPHLVLNVHMDTMPPGEEDLWSVPVWELTRRGGRLYGLGMGNMKGAVAAMVTSLAALQEHTSLWRGQVTFTAVSDEVVFGDNGAAFLMREHPDLVGDALLCGEGPGYRRLALGEKGVLWLEVGANAAPGHSSAVQAGTSASARIAEVVRRLDALNGARGSLPPELAHMAGTEDDPGLLLTVNTGTLAAGTFIGQIATTATARLDLRLPPGVTTDAATAMVESTVADLDGVTVRHLKGWDPNWTSPSSDLAQAWHRASVDLLGSPPEHAIRLPASDASRWRRLGVPALCYGPQPTWSAGIDDYADEEEVVSCAALYTLTATQYLTRS